MTIAMWSIPFALLGTTEEKLSFQDELALFYEPGKHYWGKTSSPDGDGLHPTELHCAPRESHAVRPCDL
jgi:hypothetical protein